MSDAPTVVTDPRMALHDTGAGHVERPERLSGLLEMLASRPGGPVAVEDAPPARRELIERVHDGPYIESLERLAGRSAHLDPDTSVSPSSWQAATLAAGCAIRAVELACAQRSSGSFALVRPPGHHAERDRAMGFCLLNNVAIAAERALEHDGCDRVLIFDWDVHHGNGTQHIFEQRDDVLFCSIHQHPLYPGTGLLAETGSGAGAGFTVNAPLPAGCGDAEYLRVANELLAPIARRFRPDLLLVSAGFDAHMDDPLGGMRVSTDGFGAMSAVVRDLAGELCDGRLVLCLEGGYDLSALCGSVSSVLDVLGGAPAPRAVTSAEGLADAQVTAILAHHSIDRAPGS